MISRVFLALIFLNILAHCDETNLWIELLSGNDNDLEGNIGVGLGEFIRGSYEDPILATGNRTLRQGDRPKTDLNMMSDEIL